MKTITVRASDPYKVYIGRGIADKAGEIIRTDAGGSTAAVITDSNVDPLHSAGIIACLEKSGYKTCRYVMKAGEEHKTMQTLQDILSFMADNNMSRKDIAVALGGGVTGDVCGFAAAVYMRGIRYVQIPTTVLAAVDSSVGGKTAVDLPQGKNLAGAFHQPAAVICDPDFFTTLPQRQYNNGFAEIIKYGMIKDPGLLEKLDNDITEIIADCVQMKADIVEEDEFESGKRQILNFGHSIGHAVEKLSDYTLLHGEAVACGMVKICDVAEREGICTARCGEILRNALTGHGLPVEAGYGSEDIIKAMKADKKADADAINLVMPEEPGKVIISKTSFADIRRMLV